MSINARSKGGNKPLGSSPKSGIMKEGGSASAKPSQAGSSGKGGGPMAKSQQLSLPKVQLDEFSQAVELTTNKFDKLLKSTDEMVKKSA